MSDYASLGQGLEGLFRGFLLHMPDCCLDCEHAVQDTGAGDRAACTANRCDCPSGCDKQCSVGTSAPCMTGEFGQSCGTGSDCAYHTARFHVRDVRRLGPTIGALGPAYIRLTPENGTPLQFADEIGVTADLVASSPLSTAAPWRPPSIVPTAKRRPSLMDLALRERLDLLRWLAQAARKRGLLP